MLAELVLAVSVNIVIDQCGGLSPAHCRLAVTEMAEIWRDAGVEVVSRPADEQSLQGEAAVSLRIVTFAINPNARGEPVLGSVAVDPGGRMRPVILVSLPALRLALADADVGGIAFDRLTSDLRSQLAARAIGRIAAHELGHYLLRRAGHPKKGLMRPSYVARDLIGAWLGPFRVGVPERSAAVAQIAALATVQHGTTQPARRVPEPR
jgi:hypothetical protein